ncbi:MAG: cell wall-associated NlpC family hydrolase [Saprospiraceae bacterium]|jgi:cell wall-associated NlpC family hydrolase
MPHVLIAFLLTFGPSLQTELSTVKSVEIQTANSQTAEEREADLRKWVAGYGESFGGIKYIYGGKTSKGFDCSGFTKFIFSTYGIQLSGHSQTQATEGKKIPLKEARRGDLIFFGKNGRVSHVGIICSNTEDGIVAVHSSLSKGIMTQNISKSSYWRPKILFTCDVITKYVDEGHY